MPSWFIIECMAHIGTHRIKYALVFLLLAVAILASLWPRGHYLAVRAVDDGQTVLRREVRAGSRFSITFKHSVQLSDWTDFFEVTGDYRLRLYETRFSDFGWGFPSEPDPGAKMEVTDSYIRYYDMNRVMQGFQLSVTDSADTHFITFEGEVTDLIARAGPGRLLEIEIDDR